MYNFVYVLSYSVLYKFVKILVWSTRTTSLIKKSLFFFQINAISKIQKSNFQGGKSPCGMQLAHPGLVNSKILTKPINHVSIYVRNSQLGKTKPCRMQLAGQGLVKLKSGNIPPNSIIFDTHPIEKYMSIRTWGVEGLRVV